MSTFRVGLTGGIASGKSTVARLLADEGFRVVDADEVVAELYRPGAAGAQAVRVLFGEGFLDSDGAVDMPAVAKVVFGDKEARRRLEGAVHPLVRRRFAEMAEQAEDDAEAGGVIVLEATLLVEAGYAPDFDLVVSVEAEEETRLARAVDRGADPDDARARMAAQGDGAERRAAADWILLNNGTPEALVTLTGDLAAEIERRARGSGGGLSSAILVTGNANKLTESRRILGFELAGESVDLPEIQALDLETVLRAKAEAAWQALGRPLVVEDTGLELAALNGFPGPLVKWMLDAIGAAGIARLGLAQGEPRVEAVCGILYRDAERTVLAEGRTAGTLVEPRGDGGFGWDPVFLPDGQTETYAEMGPELKDAIGHRGRAWRELLSRLGK